MTWSSQIRGRRSLLVVLGLVVALPVLVMTLKLAAGWTPEPRRALLTPPVMGPRESLSHGLRVVPTCASSLSFIVVGDFGRGGEWGQTEVAEAMKVWADEHDARFVISVGDNFYNAGLESADDPQFFTSWHDVYVRDTDLTIPWYPIMGNHDERGLPMSQVDASKHSQLWRFPALYYNVTHYFDTGGRCERRECVHVVHMRSTEFNEYYRREKAVSRSIWGVDSSVQEKWVKAALQWGKQNCAYTFVVSHHPMFTSRRSPSTAKFPTYGPQKPYRRTFGSSWSTVDAVFAGHAHFLEHATAIGTDHFVSGGGSQLDVERGAAHRFRNLTLEEDDASTEFAAQARGFLGVTVEEDRVSYGFWGTDTAAPPLYTLSRRRRRRGGGGAA